MKKMLLTISLLLISFSALTSERTVQMIKTTIPSAPKPRPRSMVIKPAVSVDTETLQLTISMVSGDSYVVYVYDGSGAVVYQGSVITDGSRQVYLLPELEADLYSISIESNSTAYEGEFHAN